tara:strand:- start:8255 stop:8644 length:390 start_codon:yes stop_codon:yes gene_type:complete
MICIILINATLDLNYISYCFIKGVYMNKKLLNLLLVGLAGFPLFTSAADIDAGKAKSATCAVCHGANGVSAVPIYPNLKGQKEAYLVSALKAYKANQRQGGMSAIMAGQAAALSDDDIANLAAYYASLE